VSGNLQIKASLTSIEATGFDFSNDGKKLYVLDDVSDSLIQYELNTPWDITTGNLNLETVKQFSLSGQGFTTPSGLAFNEDGTSMYVVGYGVDRIHQYSLSEAWNPSTATNVAALPVGGQDTAPFTLYYGNSGYSIYLQGTTGDDINQYNMKTPGDLSTASFVGLAKPLAYNDSGGTTGTQPSTTTGMVFNADGTTVIISTSSDYMRPHSLTTPWDITTTTSFNNKLMQVSGSNPRGLRYGNSGTNMYYVPGLTTANVIQYRLMYPYVTDGSAIYEKHFNPLPPNDTSATGLTISEDGTNLYIVGQTLDNITQYTLTTPWEIDTAVYEGNLNVLPVLSNPAGIRFNPEGNLLYIISETVDRIHQFELGIPWMVSTASNIAATLIGSVQSIGRDLYIRNDGVKLYTIGNDGDSADEWEMSVPWDITTLTFTGRSVNIESDPGTIDFRPDGHQFSASGVGSDTSLTHYLPNAWVFTGVQDHLKPFTDINKTRSFYSPCWSNSGMDLFVVDRSSGSKIIQYKANVAYDLTTIDYTFLTDIPVFYPGNFEATVNAITISSDNKYLFITGEGSDKIYRFEFMDPSNPRVDQLLMPIKTIHTGDWNTITNPGELTVLPSGNILITLPSIGGTIFPGRIVNGIHDFDLKEGNVWNMPNVYSNVLTSASATGGNNNEPVGIRFVNDGYRAFVLAYVGDDVSQLDLTEPYNIVTAVRDSSNVLSLNEGTSTSASTIAISDGQWLFCADTTYDAVYRYKMPEANILSGTDFINLPGTSTFNLVPYDDTSFNTLGAGMEFNPDGTKFFYCPRRYATGYPIITEFNLPNPYDIGGATESGNTANTFLLNNLGDAREMVFSRDGKTMYLADWLIYDEASTSRLTQIYFIDKNVLYSR
jgi:sugar lactone lactonase YvrE